MDDMMKQISMAINGAIQNLGPQFIDKIMRDLDKDDKPVKEMPGLQTLANNKYNKHK